MTKVSKTLILATVLAAAMSVRGDDKADVLLQAAMKKETVDGDLNGAIKQYGAIVAKYKSDRAVTAMALVHMAECYQKMGNSESQKIYERVLREFADQKEAVAVARTTARGAATDAHQWLVNITLGLPFIRTSPGHGTAYDIAGQGRADAGPMIEAILLAADYCRRGPVK